MNLGEIGNILGLVPTPLIGDTSERDPEKAQWRGVGLEVRT